MNSAIKKNQVKPKPDHTSNRSETRGLNIDMDTKFGHRNDPQPNVIQTNNAPFLSGLSSRPRSSNLKEDGTGE
jgi:hypothetical protein